MVAVQQYAFIIGMPVSSVYSYSITWYTKDSIEVLLSQKIVLHFLLLSFENFKALRKYQLYRLVAIQLKWIPLQGLMNATEHNPVKRTTKYRQNCSHSYGSSLSFPELRKKF